MKFEMPKIEVRSFDISENIAALVGDNVIFNKGGFEGSNVF